MKVHQEQFTPYTVSYETPDALAERCKRCKCVAKINIVGSRDGSLNGPYCSYNCYLEERHIRSDK